MKTTPNSTVLYVNRPTRRLRVRRVHEEAIVAALQAETDRKWTAHCDHGGGVANAYGYPAETEAMLAVRDPRGRIVVWFARLAANKVTLGGAAGVCSGQVARKIWDRRYGKAAKQAAWAQLKRAFYLVLLCQTKPGAAAEALAPEALDTLSLEDLEQLCREDHTVPEAPVVAVHTSPEAAPVAPSA